MKLLYFVTEDWYFCSHRLPIARAARDAGCEVVVATHVDAHGGTITREGFRLIPLQMRRRSKNPLRELAAVLEIISIYRRERPDLVHHVALKPVLYGALAARFTGVSAVVNALAGLGYVFSSSQSRARILKRFVRAAFRALLNRQNSVVLLQNPDDQRMLIESKTILPERTALIRGSGVNIQRFRPSPELDDGSVMVTLVARMLRDKGILEFVEASRFLRQQGVQFRAVLVGTPDPDNPTSISVSQLEAWQAEGLIEWWGKNNDIPSVWVQSHIAVLPSAYGEGVPMSLIEAAACGRPIITTDMPGCREIVQHEKNGLLVPIKDSKALADAICRLIENPGLRRQMGQEGRKLVEKEFSEAVVVEQTLKLYQSMLGELWPSRG
ncbi:glycosyltransferase family 4 protein [Beggiatoa alba]|nr:glycosyltransferase family 4 protein [Beggiatoa alba]